MWVVISWVATALTLLGLLLLALAAGASLIYGLRAWRNHRRLARRRTADVQTHVAELRCRTGSGKQDHDSLPSPCQPEEGGDQRERSPCGDRTDDEVQGGRHRAVGPPLEGRVRIAGHVLHNADTRCLPRIPPSAGEG